MDRAFVTLAVVGAVVAPAPAAAYTLKHAAEGAVVRWGRDVVRLRIDERVLEAFPDAPDALALAATAWNEASAGPTILFTGPDETDVEGSVQWVDEWAFDPHLLAVTVSRFDDQTGELLSTDVLLHATQPLAMGALGPGHYDLASVLTHELGHVLGLDESSDDEAATMWPALTPGSTHQRTLSDDDRMGLAALYAGAPLVRTSISPPEAVCVASVVPHAPGLWAVTLAAALMGIALRRARRRTQSPISMGLARVCGESRSMGAARRAP